MIAENFLGIAQVILHDHEEGKNYKSNVLVHKIMENVQKQLLLEML